MPWKPETKWLSPNYKDFRQNGITRPQLRLSFLCISILANIYICIYSFICILWYKFRVERMYSIFDITKEEVDWALQHVRKEAIPRKDCISATMVWSVALDQVWTTLFNLCWKNGLVPSLCKKSVIIPVPKK